MINSLLRHLASAKVDRLSAQELGLLRWQTAGVRFRMVSPRRLAVCLDCEQDGTVLVPNPAFGWIERHLVDALIRLQVQRLGLPVPHGLERAPALQAKLEDRARWALVQIR